MTRATVARFVLHASGTGGPEGGSATFNLTQRGSGGTNSNGTTNRNAFGSYGSDGSCYYVSVEGGDALGSNC